MAWTMLIPPSRSTGSFRGRLTQPRGVDDLTRWAWRLAGRTPNVEAKPSALRTVVYESGAWNGFRLFTYDHEYFRSNRLKLVSNYMESRRGNCVSMPILFLAKLA